MSVLDLGKLRGALVNAGLGGDPDTLGAAAIFAQQRLNRGADVGLAVWCAVGDVRRRRRCVTSSDYLRWGSCSPGRGVGNYRLAGGEVVSYVPMLGGRYDSPAGDESRELEPWVSAAMVEEYESAIDF